MASLAPFLKQRFFDANGEPLVGGKVYTYTAGTNTPRATYTDETGTSANTNPVILDANGEANIWIGNGYYKFVLKNANDVTQFTVDRVASGSGGDVAASDLTFDVFSGTGAQTVFTLSTDPLVQANTNVFISGVYQQKSTYSVSGTTLTFSEAPPTGTNNIEVSLGSAMAVAVVANGSITNAKLASNAVAAANILDGAVTTAKLADSSVSTVKIITGAVTKAKLAALGQQLSLSSGTFGLPNSNTLTDVTNLSVSITTTGRPVMLMLVSDGSANSAFVQVTNASVAPRASIQFIRGTTTISDQLLINGYAGATSQISAPPSAFQHVDPILAGTWTYKVAVKGLATTDSTNVYYTKLLAFEL